MRIILVYSLNFSVDTKKPPGWLGPVEKEYYSRAE